MAELNDRLTLWTIKDIKCWLTAIEIAALLTWQLERAHGVRCADFLHVVWGGVVFAAFACVRRRLG